MHGLLAAAALASLFAAQVASCYGAAALIIWMRALIPDQMEPASVIAFCFTAACALSLIASLAAWCVRRDREAMYVL